MPNFAVLKTVILIQDLSYLRLCDGRMNFRPKYWTQETGMTPRLALMLIVRAINKVQNSDAVEFQTHSLELRLELCRTQWKTHRTHGMTGGMAAGIQCLGWPFIKQSLRLSPSDANAACTDWRAQNSTSLSYTTAFSLNAEKEHIVILLSLSETEHLICKSADSERENTTLLLAC